MIRKMSTNIVKDIGEIYSRLFDPKPFLNGELNYFVKEFEVKRQDREVEGLFTSLQNTIEIKETIDRVQKSADQILPDIKAELENTLIQFNQSRSESEQIWEQRLKENREKRGLLWLQIVDDMQHKRSRVDNTFEEKEEELREFYSDLERKLHIHI